MLGTWCWGPSSFKAPPRGSSQRSSMAPRQPLHTGLRDASSRSPTPGSSYPCWAVALRGEPLASELPRSPWAPLSRASQQGSGRGSTGTRTTPACTAHICAASLRGSCVPAQCCYLPTSHDVPAETGTDPCQHVCASTSLGINFRVGGRQGGSCVSLQP